MRTCSQGSVVAVARWSLLGRWPTVAVVLNTVRPAWPSYDERRRNTRPRCSTAYSTWPICSTTRLRRPRSSCPSASASSCRRSRPLYTRWPPTENRNRNCRIRSRCRWPLPIPPPPLRPPLLPPPQWTRPSRHRPWPRNTLRRRPIPTTKRYGPLLQSFLLFPVDRCRRRSRRRPVRRSVGAPLSGSDSPQSVFCERYPKRPGVATIAVSHFLRIKHDEDTGQWLVFVCFSWFCVFYCFSLTL